MKAQPHYGDPEEELDTGTEEEEDEEDEDEEDEEDEEEEN